MGEVMGHSFRADCKLVFLSANGLFNLFWHDPGLSQGRPFMRACMVDLGLSMIACFQSKQESQQLPVIVALNGVQKYLCQEFGQVRHDYQH